MNPFLKILNEVGAVITDSHIVYTSGKHGTAYINKDALYPHIRETEFLCHMLAEHFVNDDVDVVIGPAVGGVILSQWTAFGLSLLMKKAVLSTYAEKEIASFLHPSCIGVPGATRQAFEETGRFVIKRGYDRLITGKNVLVVEDILMTGDSARKVVAAARSISANVVGLGALCNRGGVTREMVGSVPRLTALVNITMDSWTEDECARTGPCSRGISINTDVGHGRFFLAQKEQHERA